MPFAIALDLGGTQTRAALVDEHGNVSNRVSLPTPAQDGGDAVVAKLAEARSLGLMVVVWTVNAPADISRMLELGVDGIISDRPDLVRTEMQKRGMALPASTPVSP